MLDFELARNVAAGILEFDKCCAEASGRQTNRQARSPGTRGASAPNPPS